jgi:hypothetical protein
VVEAMGSSDVTGSCIIGNDITGMTSPELEPEMKGDNFPRFLHIFPAFSPRISGGFFS